MADRNHLAHFTGMDIETFSKAFQAVFQDSRNTDRGFPGMNTQPIRGRDVYAESMPSLRHSACLIALRQEIWSVLVHNRSFRLPILDVDDDESAKFDEASSNMMDDYDWTNRIIVWCAHVLKLCFQSRDDWPQDTQSGDDFASRAEQIRKLKAFQKRWDEDPPAQFTPLYYEDRDPDVGRYFPTIWLANRCQVIGLQHVELARIMLAIHDSDRRPSTTEFLCDSNEESDSLDSILRQSTRRMCGLAMSNQRYQECMVTAAVGISMCGEYFREPLEQAAILELMTLLEREHAWPMSSVMNKLQSAWAGTL